MKSLNFIFTHAALFVAGLVLTAASARAQLVDSWNADTLAPGSVSSWAPVVGTDDATFANAAAYLGYPGNPGVVAPTVSNTDAAFNGHNSVSFTFGNALATAGALFSGTQDRTLAAVYTTPIGDNFAVNPIVGETASGVAGTWFMLQARDAGVSGNPYLAGYSVPEDVSSGTNPVTDQLTFALATYSAGVGETLYWAYGDGAISSATNPTAVLNTAAVPLAFGGETDTGPLNDMNIGTVQVYDSSLTGAEAEADIVALQDYYYDIPEPSTYALIGASLLVGVVFLRRRKVS